MFHPNRLVRGHASELVLHHINRSIKFHGDTLKPDDQHNFEPEDDETFALESLERGMKIWTDTRMDAVVRWTALGQVHIQLRKPVAHENFNGLHGPETLVTMMRLIVDGTEKVWTTENLVMLMDSLNNVIYYNDRKSFLAEDRWGDQHFFQKMVCTVHAINGDIVIQEMCS